MRRFFLIVTVTSLFLLGLASTSSAMPYNSWDFDIQYGFSSFVDGDASLNPSHPVTGYIPNTDFNNYPTMLEWGSPVDGVNSSSIVVAPASQTDTLLLGDPPIGGVTLTHNNFPIWDGTGTLESAVLASRLTLKPTGAPFTLPVFTRDFYIHFLETSNSGPHPDDIFMITGFEGFLQDFTLDGYTYRVLFDVEDFVELTTFEKSLLGVPTDQPAYGFTTPEGLQTTKDTWLAMELIPSPVPEPSTLILLGLGILGIAGLAKRRIK